MTAVYLDIANAIVTQIQAVSNTGQVYNRQRYTAKWNDYISRFVSMILGEKKVRGFTVTLQSITDGPEDGTADTLNGIGYLYLYKVIGINAFKDVTSNSTGSENDFITVVENVLDQINACRSFNLSTEGVVPFGIIAWLPRIDIRQFGDVMCNVVELDINVSVYKVLNYIN